MKKWILLIGLFILTLALQAQVINMKDKYYHWYEGSTVTDTIKSTTAKTFAIKVYKDFPYFYDISINIDTVVALGVDFTVKLQGSHNNTSMSYTDIGSSVTWANIPENLVADTTIRFTNLTSAQTITSTVASYTITDVTRDTIPTYNMFISDSTFEAETVAGEDTITVDQVTKVSRGTKTVAAQTTTSTVSTGKVGWMWLRIVVTGSGSTARALLDRIDCAILKDD